MTDRDENGRFVANNKASVGNKGGGRLPKTREEKYYEITMKSCPLKDWRAIMKKVVEMAKRGDKFAIKFLADYLIGTPEQNLNLHGQTALDVILHYVEEDKLD